MKRAMWVAVGLGVVSGAGYWLLHTAPDPRELVLGEWKEVSSRTYVEVMPGKAVARGMLHGTVQYEWLQTQKEPYRLRFTYRQKPYEAQVYLPDADSAVVEPDVWAHMPAEQQKAVREMNRARNRPEQELRFLFKRVPQRK